VADLLSGLTTALIPLLALTVGLPFWALLALVAAGSLCDVPGATARQVLYPDLAERAGIPPERANAWYQAVSRAAQLVGPPLAGLSIALVGTANVLWLNAASFAVSATLFAAAVPAVTRPAPTSAPGSYLADRRDGARFLFRDRLLRLLTWTISLTNLLDAALAAVVVPVFVRRTFGEGASTGLGLIFGVFSAGSPLGSVAFAAVGYRLPRRATYRASPELGGEPLPETPVPGSWQSARTSPEVTTRGTAGQPDRAPGRWARRPKRPGTGSSSTMRRRRGTPTPRARSPAHRPTRSRRVTPPRRSDHRGGLSGRPADRGGTLAGGGGRRTARRIGGHRGRIAVRRSAQSAGQGTV